MPYPNRRPQTAFNSVILFFFFFFCLSRRCSPRQIKALVKNGTKTPSNKKTIHSNKKKKKKNIGLSISLLKQSSGREELHNVRGKSETAQVKRMVENNNNNKKKENVRPISQFIVYCSNSRTQKKKEGKNKKK